MGACGGYVAGGSEEVTDRHSSVLTEMLFLIQLHTCRDVEKKVNNTCHVMTQICLCGTLTVKVDAAAQSEDTPVGLT